MQNGKRFPDYGLFKGVPLLDVCVVDGERRYLVAITLEDVGQINMIALSGKINGKLKIMIHETHVIDEGGFGHNPELTLNMAEDTICAFLRKYMPNMKWSGYEPYTCYVNAEGAQLFNTPDEPSGLVLGSDRVKDMILASGFAISEATEVSGYPFPAWYEQHKGAELANKPVKVAVAPRLSKEDWLRQNYPGMTELPKWRFPAVAG
jgi:hypothetical protein